MARRAKDVTDAELAVLRALWDAGPSTVRILTDRIYPEGSTSEYATVQKLLERLEAKSCVSKNRQGGRSNVYAATVQRDDLVARRLRQTAEQLCNGSMTPLLTHLVSAGQLNEDELAELQGLVDRLSKGVER